MGVKFRVTSNTVTSVRLGLSNNPGTNKLSLPIAVSRDEAIRIKPSLRAYAIVTLVEPYKIGGNGTKTASLSDPDEYLWKYFGLHVNLKAIWLVNKKTGEVLVKREMPLQ
jgi:hypothetical protein